MVSNSILGTVGDPPHPARYGAQWHAIRVYELPEDLQEIVRRDNPEGGGSVYWREQAALWHTLDQPLPQATSAAILGHVIRLRRAEPHLAFPNGHVFYYLDPESSYCTLSDLEKNLEGQNRYAGAVRWTVGQHWRFCEKVTEIWHTHWKTVAGKQCLEPSPADLESERIALLLVRYHDHAEGACQDLNAGLKRALRALWSSGQSEYDELEARAEAWVRRRIPALPKTSEALAKFVKWVDTRAAWIEMGQFGFPDYFVEEAADGQAPVLPEEIEAFRKIQGETHAP